MKATETQTIRLPETAAEHPVHPPAPVCAGELRSAKQPEGESRGFSLIARSEALELRRLDRTNALELNRLLALPEMAPHLVMRRQSLPGAYLKARAAAMLSGGDGRSLHTGIYVPGQGELLGVVSLQHIRPADGTAVLGFLVDPRHWGRGIATGAVRLMLEHAFTGMDLTAVEGRCRSDNEASRRVMLSSGFLEYQSIGEACGDGVMKLYRIVTQMK